MKVKGLDWVLLDAPISLKELGLVPPAIEGAARLFAKLKDGKVILAYRRSDGEVVDLEAFEFDCSMLSECDLSDLGSADHDDLSNVTPDQHHAEDHAARHGVGGDDELEVESLPTSEVDTSKVLAPDGAGGVQWREETGGNGGGGPSEPGGCCELLVADGQCDPPEMMTTEDECDFVFSDGEPEEE